MTLSQESATAMSVAGRSGSQYIAWAAIHVSCGSMHTNSVPCCMQATSQWPRYPSALDFSGSQPHTTTTSGRTHSPLT